MARREWSRRRNGGKIRAREREGSGAGDGNTRVEARFWKGEIGNPARIRPRAHAETRARARLAREGCARLSMGARSSPRTRALPPRETDSYVAPHSTVPTVCTVRGLTSPQHVRRRDVLAPSHNIPIIGGILNFYLHCLVTYLI